MATNGGGADLSDEELSELGSALDDSDEVIPVEDVDEFMEPTAVAPTAKVRHSAMPTLQPRSAVTPSLAHDLVSARTGSPVRRDLSSDEADFSDDNESTVLRPPPTSERTLLGGRPGPRSVLADASDDDDAGQPTGRTDAAAAIAAVSKALDAIGEQGDGEPVTFAVRGNGPATVHESARAGASDLLQEFSDEAASVDDAPRRRDGRSATVVTTHTHAVRDDDKGAASSEGGLEEEAAGFDDGETAAQPMTRPASGRMTLAPPSAPSQSQSQSPVHAASMKAASVPRNGGARAAVDTRTAQGARNNDEDEAAASDEDAAPASSSGDAFDDVKTRALAVDGDLLARLKRGEDPPSAFTSPTTAPSMSAMPRATAISSAMPAPEVPTRVPASVDGGRAASDPALLAEAAGLETQADALEEEARTLRARATELRQRAQRRQSTSASSTSSTSSTSSLAAPPAAPQPIAAARGSGLFRFDRASAAAPAASSAAPQPSTLLPQARPAAASSHSASSSSASLLPEIPAEDLVTVTPPYPLVKRGASPVAPAAPAASEDGVSLAALQGVLDDDSDDGDGAFAAAGDATSTVVGKGAPGIGKLDPAHDDDGDVWGSSGNGDRSDGGFGSDADASPEIDDDDEPTNIKPREAGRVVLVVSDARARERLRTLLEPYFKDLVEASNAEDAAQLSGVARLDGMVFVRPTATAENLEGLATLHAMRRRPRILVLSADVTFDTTPAVDLRMPLSQKASEVAQQIVDGLGRLGVASNEL